MDLHPYYPLLRQTSLLRGMRDDELDLLLRCFAPRVRRYQKGELLLLAGYETREVGIFAGRQDPGAEKHAGRVPAWPSPRWARAGCSGMCCPGPACAAR